MPARQQPERVQQMYLAVRTSADAAAAAAAIRAEVRQLDPNVPVFAVRTMPEILAASLDSQRLTNILLGSFAGMALLLAAVGIYGVMSLSVSACTQEFGIRMALGAGRADVFRLVVGQGMAIATAGVAAGVLAALVLARYLRTLLFEVSPADPATFVVVTVVLGAAAFAACYLPARRATRVDAMVALRYE
jgi:putative ABC transport system permease protein